MVDFGRYMFADSLSVGAEGFEPSFVEFALERLQIPVFLLGHREYSCTESIAVGA